MRRQRYTVTLDTGSQHVVLAYSPDGAKACYRNAASVRRGDFRVEALRNADRGNGFKVDQAALREAIEFFGLKLPVKIRFSARDGRKRGSHTLLHTGGRVRMTATAVYHLDTATGSHHDIMVKSYLNPERASRILWHELTHAMQCERAIAAADAQTPKERNAAWHEVSAASRGVGYHYKPVEIEARAHEAYAEALPLAVPR